MLLRLGGGATLIYLGLGDSFTAYRVANPIVPDLLAAAASLFLLAGLWTPLAAAFIAVDESWIAFTRNSLPADCEWIHILLVLLLVALAMLGPGAWSIDARLFGRKRFLIGERSGLRKP